MKALLSSPSALFFDLVEFSRTRVFLPFSAARIFFLNASVQKENGGERTHGKEKEAAPH